MRKSILFIIGLLALSMSSVSSCARSSEQKKETEKSSGMKTEKKVLVAYFSHTGENYAVGNITKGNTCIVAEMIAEATGGKLFEIVPEKEYPTTYDACVDLAKREKEAGARPAVKGDIKTDDYDVVFIGYPNWWSDMPMPVYTFLEKHDWSGKTIVPFCTHEGSGLSNTGKYIADTCKGATVVKGLAVRGETAQNHSEQTCKTVLAWLKKLGF